MSCTRKRLKELSDHFTVAASIPLTSRKSYKKELEKKKVRKLKNLVGDNTLNLHFLLDQKLETIQSTLCTEVRAQMVCEKIIECIDKCITAKKSCLSLKMRQTRGLPTNLKTHWSNEIASSEPWKSKLPKSY